MWLLECIGCSLQYIEQTKRALKERIVEHQRPLSSHVVGPHRDEKPGHYFNYDHTRILHKVTNLHSWCFHVVVKQCTEKKS